MYRYYLTQRPASPGAFPAADDNPPEEVHNYDCRTFVPEIQCLAWGYVEYRRPLELYDVSIYELMEAPTGEGIMEDQNGRKILTGDVVRVTGAQPKADNGLFFVERSPRDPNWEPEMYCLMRLCENGRLSAAARNIAYWPNPNGQADTAKIEVLPDFRALQRLRHPRAAGRGSRAAFRHHGAGADALLVVLRQLAFHINDLPQQVLHAAQFKTVAQRIQHAERPILPDHILHFALGHPLAVHQRQKASGVILVQRVRQRGQRFLRPGFKTTGKQQRRRRQQGQPRPAHP